MHPDGIALAVQQVAAGRVAVSNIAEHALPPIGQDHVDLRLRGASLIKQFSGRRGHAVGHGGSLAGDPHLRGPPQVP